MAGARCHEDEVGAVRDRRTRPGHEEIQTAVAVEIAGRQIRLAAGIVAGDIGHPEQHGRGEHRALGTRRLRGGDVTDDRDLGTPAHLGVLELHETRPRVCLERLERLDVGFGLVAAIEPLERLKRPVVGAAQVGIPLDRPLEPAQRLLEALELHQALTDVVGRLEITGVDFGDEKKIFESGLGITRVQRQNAADIPRPKVSRIIGNDPVEDRFGRRFVTLLLSIEHSDGEVDPKFRDRCSARPRSAKTWRAASKSYRPMRATPRLLAATIISS